MRGGVLDLVGDAPDMTRLDFETKLDLLVMYAEELGAGSPHEDTIRQRLRRVRAELVEAFGQPGARRW